jgi:putative membrane protein
LLVLLLPTANGQAADNKTSTVSPKTKLSSDETNFIKDAAQGGLMEVQLGQLAQEKTGNEKVKEFGKRMEQDHSKANEELKKLASDKDVQLSNELDKKHKRKGRQTDEAFRSRLRQTIYGCHGQRSQRG